MSVAELERRYGPNAQVELRSAPINPGASSYVAEDSYYDPAASYEDEPVELPVRRSPWLAAVILAMLGIGAFLGFALYRQGLIPARFTHEHVAMSPTDSLPVTDELATPPTLPLLSMGSLHATVSSAVPAEEPSTASDGARPAGGNEQINVVNPPASAALPRKQSVASARSSIERKSPPTSRANPNNRARLATSKLRPPTTRVAEG